MFLIKHEIKVVMSRRPIIFDYLSEKRKPETENGISNE
jgi:hypothetical protein